MSEQGRKRKRAVISCTLCRRRKIRCNRENPCSSYVTSKTGCCVYEAETGVQRMSATTPVMIQPRDVGVSAMGAPRMQSVSRGGYTPSLSASSLSSSHSSFEFNAMRARIADLEATLSRATSTTSSVYSPPASTPPSCTHAVHTVSSFACTVDVLQDTRMMPSGAEISRGILHKNRVFGQSHWMNGFLIFREVIEMIEPLMEGGASTLVASIQRAKVLARVIKSQRSPTWPTLPTRALPPKHVCDVLVEGYLRTMETVYRVLHIPSFKRHYENLWTYNDTEPSMAFIMMLKLVLAIGATVYDEHMSMRIDATRWVYEAQTWVSSPTFKSQLGVQYLQISVLLLLARELVDVGQELVWISVGAVYRSAVYIGLHKDPSQLPRMTVMEAEMRKRMWNTLLELSLQSSMQSGGPPFISLDDFNTAPPENYDDEQLLEADPVAKPDGVYTQTSVAIALRKTLPGRLAVLKFLNDLASTGTYEATLRIDTELRTAHKTLRRTMQGYMNDASTSQFASEAVEFIMQRYITSLHVPFFAPALNNPLYAFSRKAVVASSLKIWSLTFPISKGSSLYPPGETDLARMSRCAAGFFRMYAFHASTFLATELRTRMQEEEDPDTLSVSLVTVVKDAASAYLRCMQAGETGCKGYLLLRLLDAWADATTRRVDRSELPALFVKAAEQATEVCIPVLEVMAGTQQPDTGTTGVLGADGTGGLGDYDFQLSPEFMEDWDMLMSDTFRLGDAENFDAFLS
ncbi:C6 zinc finger domain containing [Pyrenophora seminiperda CCB06]|uniref:C6 zinc finger domain containing n=1 Tax=Pyrenophora seminiperda CCB06 TaxID=1302712 RepID=A0A3M7MDK2_9PLEO|nr:C6 zinc finger domain containing [Pyrenophora seminiperda CCB06]